MTPAARTMDWLREQGYTVGIVERRLPKTVTTVDLFGCIDLVALHPDYPGVLGVQATTTSNLSKRVAKARAEARADLWMACGNRLWCVGWALWDSTGRWTEKVVDLKVAVGDTTGLA